MAKRSTTSDELHKGDKVVATVHLRDVPEGTEGKVAMVSGLTWIRYWVRFSNGVALGSINRSHLATPEQWQRKLAGLDEPTAAAASADGAGAAAADGDGGSGGVTTPAGHLVPQKLIDRSKAARARLAA